MTIKPEEAGAVALIEAIKVINERIAMLSRKTVRKVHEDTGINLHDRETMDPQNIDTAYAIAYGLRIQNNEKVSWSDVEDMTGQEVTEYVGYDFNGAIQGFLEQNLPTLIQNSTATTS